MKELKSKERCISEFRLSYSSVTNEPNSKKAGYSIT